MEGEGGWEERECYPRTWELRANTKSCLNVEEQLRCLSVCVCVCCVLDVQVASAFLLLSRILFFLHACVFVCVLVYVCVVVYACM